MSESTNEKKRRYLVTSALPYANGPLHVGQISGAYLPADTFVRYLRARGEDVVYACGTDEHGVPITLTAEREGNTPPRSVTEKEVMRSVRKRYKRKDVGDSCGGRDVAGSRRRRNRLRQRQRLRGAGHGPGRREGEERRDCGGGWRNRHRG